MAERGVAIVIGVGAEAGLGARLCQRFAKEGLHVVIDGGIAGERIARFAEFVAQKGEDGLLDLDALADTWWMLHRQHRTAWTFELDLRPFKEPF